jgi:hypothetical protein
MEGKKIKYVTLEDCDEIKDIESMKEFKEEFIKKKLIKYWKFEDKNEIKFDELRDLLLQNSKSKNWPSKLREAYLKGNHNEAKEILKQLSNYKFT